MFHCLLRILMLLPLRWPLTQASSCTSVTSTHSSYESRDENTANGMCLDGCANRTLIGIIWSCVLTTVICAWSTVHMNILPPESGIVGWLKGRLKRILFTLGAIIVPEALPALAFKQMVAAFEVQNMYNNSQAHVQREEGAAEDSPVRRPLSLISSIVKELKADFSVGRGPGEWTLRQAHFLIMGGIHLVEPREETEGAMASNRSRGQAGQGVPGDLDTLVVNIAESESESVVILTFEMLREIIKDEELISMINITDSEIKDKSKGNTLSASIFVVQTSWFVLQCLVRFGLGLGVTQLELSTAALASLNAMTLVLWWKKPLDVEVPIRVLLPRRLTPAERNAGRDRKKENRRASQQKYQNVALRVLISPFVFLLVPFLNLRRSSSIPIDAKRVPTFYAPNPARHHGHIVILAFTIFLFAILHLPGYPLTTFPTDIERKLWLATSLTMVSAPLSYPLMVTPVIFILWFIYKPQYKLRLMDPITWLPDKVNKPFKLGRRCFQAIVVFTYVVARVVLLGLAIAALRRQPDKVYRIVDWSKINWQKFLDFTKYFPHISS